MTTKKMPARKKTKKKRIVKTTQGKTLKEARAQAMGATSFWPWELRPYQQASYDQFEAGRQRQILIWHRRAGKDVFSMSLAQHEMRRRIGGYVHFFPKHVQARRAIWNGLDPKKGAKFVDIAFGEIEAERNNTDMLIEAYNGATWQLLGSDNYDRVVGSNIVGAVFSEWALCDPRAWDYIRPMILENDGWAIFITTYRGRNHAWQMVQKLKDNPRWYVDVRSVEDTQDRSGNRIITEADIQAEREDEMSEAMIQQEYFCNPEATAEGAIYGRQVEQLRRDTVRQQAQWNPNKPVYCVWNLDLPIHASYVLLQPGTTPTILESNTLHFTTLNHALAAAEQHRFPVQTHVLMDSQRELAPYFHDLRRHPEIYTERGGPAMTIATANFLDRCLIDGGQCEFLLDSLSGYVRRERFDAQVADMQYADYAVESWHTRLVRPLEVWAAWEYHAGDGGGWQSQPDYSTQDRISKTLL